VLSSRKAGSCQNPILAEHLSSLWKTKKKIFSLLQAHKHGSKTLGIWRSRRVDCSHAEEKPLSTAKTLLPQRVLNSLDEHTRQCEDAALNQTIEDLKLSSTNGKRRTEGVKRVRLSKRHLDGGVLMTRGEEPYVYDNSKK